MIILVESFDARENMLHATPTESAASIGRAIGSIAASLGPFAREPVAALLLAL